MGLENIKGRIAAAVAAAGRPQGDVRLIAVSKVQPPDRVEAVLNAGHRVFGENYVQEAAGKWPGWREVYSGTEVHMIGPLQTNKLKLALDLFDAIHTLDRPSLAQKLARQVQARGSCPQLFVQVNIGDEPQKAGVLPDDTDNFIRDCESLDLPVFGLMCIPPEDQRPRPYFAAMRVIAERNGLAGLSMGMSADFEDAIAEGATHVRVGSAIFGARDYS
ncbi:YggS family pyridoxal phosphate-dependent enzyme [Paracoccus aestuariivivens]|uniref:Pyridoxal phosphate homeostasis protein n=1 Tax=Paracoccus aestuariivivens TaxID=1820333 RepID=A0A6L6JC15_9RHOB|nr:YggS family pyridoxal phosphate-dependent enzyme [Paracoccus aestuariivivens]MTH78219.1 YggS family pyridoxal phosphate-dependent enzyme [Paracoccus aestuariivivens]